MRALSLPKADRIYHSKMTNSTRWEAFRPRDGDVFICTASKSGTTWMQSFCAHIILQTTKFDLPISEISPWFDCDPLPTEEYMAALDAQEHRRFIKTHTPLDGIPYYENATYLHVARDPRDVLFSMINHLENTKEEAPPHLRNETFEDKFERWISASVEAWGQRGGLSLDYVLHHVESFWKFRHLPNVHMFHYAHMKAEREYEMRRVAHVLGIDVAPALWPELVAGTSFEKMKENASVFVPTAGGIGWKDDRKFFDKGRSNSWKTAFSEEQLARYDTVIDARVDLALRAWVEAGELDPSR